MPDDRENDSLGSWIRRRRKALDLTQAVLADQVGCAEVTIRKLEADVARPSRQVAERLATCLALPPDERALFLQVARGERSPDRLPRTLARSDSGAHAAEVPIAPVPLDRVPLPAPLPPASRMPLRRNPLFVGRSADLYQLARALTVSETAAIGQLEIAAATGLGGIGKTQLACEFVHRYGPFFPGGVFWLSFADPAAVPAEVAACGGMDGMQLSPNFGTLPLDEQVQRVLTAWKEPILRLLVFDNCEDEALLHQWQPRHGGCRVLLTSRRHHWDPTFGVQTVPLDVLPRAESIALLCQLCPNLRADDADLQAIAETLGDLPLALYLAGSFLGKYRHVLTPAQYLQRLHTPTILDDRSLQAAGLSPTLHVQHVARTFEQSYAQLDPAAPIDAVALRLLAHAACFAPAEPIPRALLLETLTLPEDDVEGTLLAEDALTRLIDLGLLDSDAAGNLRLHRLVVAFIRAVLAHDTAQAAVEATLLRVTETLNEQRNHRRLLTVQPHLRFVTEAALPRADARTADLCTALGGSLWLQAVLPEAQSYLEQALAICERLFGPDHPKTARCLNVLSAVLYEQGQHRAAQRYQEYVLTIRQRVLGPEHGDTAGSLHNLGLTLSAQGQYAEAQGYLEQAVATQQRAFGAEHPNTPRFLNSLGEVLRMQGRYAEAQGYLEQAVAIQQRAFGAEHPDTARYLNSLGEVLLERGQYAEAQGYLEQAVAICERVLRADHPSTAVYLNALGRLCQTQGQYAEAQGYLEQAVAIQQRAFGAEHPSTALSLTHLGLALSAQGLYAEAQGYLEQALAICERVFGPDHPDTARCLSALGEVLRKQGRYAAAQGYLEQAVAICERVFGPDHPDTALILTHLGSVLEAQGQDGAARHSYEQALAINQSIRGPDHPDTHTIRSKLARLAHEDDET
ncbi:MAG TPA: tetratricopeptide repeat protein [Herpetosiphonaceae bacterium]